jgi:hypothetical protein
MSLKAVHLVFVTALSALTFGCAVWFLKDYRAPGGSQLDLLLGCISLAAGVAVLVYGRYFLKKLKNISYL